MLKNDELRTLCVYLYANLRRVSFLLFNKIKNEKCSRNVNFSLRQNLSDARNRVRWYSVLVCTVLGTLIYSRIVFRL